MARNSGSSTRRWSFFRYPTLWIQTQRIARRHVKIPFTQDAGVQQARVMQRDARICLLRYTTLVDDIAHQFSGARSFNPRICL